MTFLIDSIKDRFESDEEESEGFDDMNYLVGNTSGLDIGQVPGPIDQRIGRMSQIGGEIMEVQITNPTTFQIDRREILNVINRLDLDITLHGDPNIGFTGAYATRAQQAAGFNIVHRYMKRYLEQMAAFKWEIDKNDALDFSLGYVNMHASNEQVPSLEERLASDVAMDPFGNSMIEFDYEENDDANFWKNEDFMEDLFEYWFKEVVDRPSRFYDPQARPGIFSSADKEGFREDWEDAQRTIAIELFRNYSDEEKLSLFQTASGIDTDTSRNFRETLDRAPEIDLEEEFTLSYAVKTGMSKNDEGKPTPDLEMREGKFRFHIGSLGEFVQSFKDRANDTRLLMDPRRLDRHLATIARGDIDLAYDDPREIVEFPSDFEIFGKDNINLQKLEKVNSKVRNSVSESIESIESSLIEHVSNLWRGEYEIDREDDNLISVSAQVRSLADNQNVQRNEIWEQAEKEVEPQAKATFASSDWDTKKEILDQMAGGRVRDDLLKESRIFFNIMPAWMQNADYEAVRFIWDEIVGQEFESYDHFQDYLNEKRENQLDVIAAVGCAYIWGHWTQIEDKFEKEAFKEKIGDFEEPEMPEEGKNCTWIEWMNRFGLKVNLEAMYGDPGQLRRVWRPKDIAVVCHAINMTARKRFDEDEWHEDHDDRSLVKFTIDMEHTASYGVDPYEEIKKLISQEENISSNGWDLGIDQEKPLSRIVKTYHLTKPGWESQQGHRHGPFARGDTTLYKWLYRMIEKGFARNQDDEAIVMFEVGGDYREEMYVIRVAMDMIQRGVSPDDLDPESVPLDGDYENMEQSLQARFFGLDEAQYASEMAKIEQHAFDPLQNLIQAEEFDYTYSSVGAIKEDLSPRDYPQEEYR